MIFVTDKGRMCNNILQYGHVTLGHVSMAERASLCVSAINTNISRYAIQKAITSSAMYSQNMQRSGG